MNLDRATRLGAVWFGAVWFGAVWFGAVRFGAVRFGAVALLGSSVLLSSSVLPGQIINTQDAPRHQPGAGPHALLRQRSCCPNALSQETRTPRIL